MGLCVRQQRGGGAEGSSQGPACPVLTPARFLPPSRAAADALRTVSSSLTFLPTQSDQVLSPESLRSQISDLTNS